MDWNAINLQAIGAFLGAAFAAGFSIAVSLFLDMRKQKQKNIYILRLVTDESRRALITINQLINVSLTAYPDCFLAEPLKTSFYESYKHDLLIFLDEYEQVFFSNLFTRFSEIQSDVKIMNMLHLEIIKNHEAKNILNEKKSYLETYRMTLRSYFSGTLRII